MDFRVRSFFSVIKERGGGMMGVGFREGIDF